MIFFSAASKGKLLLRLGEVFILGSLPRPLPIICVYMCVCVRMFSLKRYHKICFSPSKLELVSITFICVMLYPLTISSPVTMV